MKIAYIGIDLLYPALPALAGGCEIMELFTCKTDNKTEFNLKICAFAQQHNIPLSMEKITRADLTRLRKNGCDAVICGGYYHRIPVDQALPMLNIHPALLPIGRGAWPMPVTILRNLPESGISIHKMTEAFDEGDILLQEAVAVAADDNLQTLTAKLQALLPGMMEQLYTQFRQLWIHAVPQIGGEYWLCPAESDYPITQDMTAAEADRILRAFYGYACVYRTPDTQYHLIGGVLHTEGTVKDCRFPVSGGFITAEQVEEIQ